ncbi:predicted protein, partial [Postia placenta Mad-698-R]
DTARTQLQTEVMKLAERYKALEKTLREMQETLRTQDKEIEALRQERDRLIAERDQARSERDQERAKGQIVTDESRSDNGVVQMSNTGERKNRHRSRSRSRPQVHRMEPIPPVPATPRVSADAEQFARARSMDIFLTKTDSWSGAQVIQAVEDLNTEINQFAASATEACVFAKRMKSRNTPPNEDPSAMQEEENAPWLGEAFARVLGTRDHAQDPILVQLALQASIATCCARSLSLFCVGFPSKLDALLSRVLTYMQSAEPQATSARWRALTHRTIRMLYPGLEEYAITELVATMLRWSATVFALAGSSPAGEHTPPLVLSTQLRRIADAVYKLARVTREEILSTGFEVVLVESGEEFEDGKMTNKMRDYEEYLADDHGHAGARPDGYAGGDRKVNGDQGQVVLCTTELGLRCITRKTSKGAASDEDAQDDLFENRMLLLPKVVLNSGVDAIGRA